MLICGRRWGKTATGLLATLKGHGAYRGQRIGALDGGNIAWIGKTNKQSRKIWRELKRSTESAWLEKHEVDHAIYLPGGGRVTVWSAEQPDNIRGDGLDGVVCDEGAFMSAELWHAVLRPSLSDRLGWGMFTTTPNGFNWLKDLHDQVPVLDDWESWQMPTWTNPVISPSEILEAKKTLPPLTFRQEYGAEFVQQEGVEWPGEYFGEHIWYGDGELPPDVHCTVVGVDPSKGKSDKSDYSAFATVHEDPRGIYWIDADIGRYDISQIASRAVHHCQQCNPQAIGFEVNAFQEAIGNEFLRLSHQAALAVNYYGITNTINKLVRIRTLGPLLANRRIRVKRNIGGVLLVEQLREFPVGDFDDGPDALEMGIRLCQQMTASAA